MGPVPVTDAEPRSEFDPLVGTKIADKYLVKRLLATGSISLIYLVVTDEKEMFALKILKDIYRETEERQRFENEVEILVLLDHARIIGLIDLGIHNYRPFFVTEYCEYGNFGAYWKESYLHFNPKYVLQILQQLGDAVQYLHSVGIIHCDINPGNILLRAPTDLVLSDFTSSRQRDVASGPSTGADHPGSPRYMAPEQWLNETITPATDQYALGVLAYLLLTGRHPIDGDPQFIRTSFENAPDYQSPTPSSLNRYLNVAVDSVILTALSRNPADRYETISAFLAELEDALGYEEAEKNAQSPRRRSALPIIIFALVVLALIVLGVVLSSVARDATAGLISATATPVAQVVPTDIRIETIEPTLVPTSTSTLTAIPPTATDVPTLNFELLVAQSLTSIVLSASPTTSPSATPAPTATPLPTLTEILAGLLPGTPNRFDCDTYLVNYEILFDAIERGEAAYMAAARLFSFDDSTANLIYSACNAVGNTPFARIDSTLYADLRFEINLLNSASGTN